MEGSSDWHGEHIDGTRVPKLDWSRTEFVVVTGVKSNPCGHALLHVGGGLFGHYFHVPGAPGWYERPYHVPGEIFESYLARNGKKEIGRLSMNIPCPDAAEKKLRELLNRRWPYGVLPSNCVSFIQEILAAGGNFWNLANCPKMEPLHWEWLDKNIRPRSVVAGCPVPMESGA